MIEEKEKKQEKEQEELVRIMQTDISGNKNIYGGLAKIKGVSFAMSNAICHILKLDNDRKIGSLSQEEIDKISETIRNPKVPDFLKNRRKDFDTGESKHLSITELDLKKEFDIKRLNKIKSYRGVRHSRGLPVRGQRTRSHFRQKGKHKAIGVKTKKTGKKG